ncbi:hypothetical protein MTO96_040722 [Rhipicephalus appendiculatus]
MEDMLRHYENECTFHTVECLSCGERVLHRELAAHFVAGCSAGVCSASTENISPESRTLTLRDVSEAFEKVKTALRYVSDDQLLPAIQSHLNELTEEVRNHEFRLAEITREPRASAGAGTVQDAVVASSTVLQEPNSRHYAADEAIQSSSFYFSQEMLNNQESEIFFKLSPGVLERMQKTSTQDYPQHYIDYSESPTSRCHFMMTRELSTTKLSSIQGLRHPVPHASRAPSATVGDDRQDRELRPGMNTNRYATKKTVAQGLLDVALLTANTSQLKSVILRGPQYEFYNLLLVLLSLSIGLQIMVGVLLLVLGFINVNNESNHRLADILNNVATAAVFGVTVVNVMSASFDSPEEGVSLALQQPANAAKPPAPK